MDPIIDYDYGTFGKYIIEKDFPTTNDSCTFDSDEEDSFTKKEPLGEMGSEMCPQSLTLHIHKSLLNK